MIGKFVCGGSKHKRGRSKCHARNNEWSELIGKLRLRTSNILLIGMKGLGNEIAKNLVLAGIGSLTIQDDGLLTTEDLGAQFLCTEKDLGTNVSSLSRLLSRQCPMMKCFHSLFS